MALRTKTVRISAGKTGNQIDAPNDFGLGGRHGTQPSGAPFTIPGPSADLNVEGEEQEDTIFGVDWRSNVAGPLRWSVSSRAFIRGRAGYFSDVSYFEAGFESPAAVGANGNQQWGAANATYYVFKQAGSAAGNVKHNNADVDQREIYQFIKKDKTTVSLGFRDDDPIIIDPAAATDYLEDEDVAHATAAPSAANTAFARTAGEVDGIQSIDPLRCQIHYDVTTQPTWLYVKVRSQEVVKKLGRPSSFSMTASAEMIDTTSMNDLGEETGTEAQNVFRYMISGLKTATFEMSGIFQENPSNTIGDPTGLQLNVAAREHGVWMIIRPAGVDNGDTFMAGQIFPISRSQRGDVGALEEETFTGTLRVAADDVEPVVFSALFGTAAKSLDFMWEKFVLGEDVFVEYAPEGIVNTNRVFAGRAIPMDMSLTCSLDGVPEFSVGFDGSGPLIKATYAASGSGTITTAGVPTV